MLAVAGVTAYKQSKEITASGYKLSKQHYSNVKRGKRIAVSIMFIEALACYWGLSVRDMLADGEAFALIVAEKLPNLGGLSRGESNG